MHLSLFVAESSIKRTCSPDRSCPHQAERQLAEKDEVFSDTCQRLLDAQRRIAQLEDQLVKEAEAPWDAKDWMEKWYTPW